MNSVAPPTPAPLLANYFCDTWQNGQGEGIPLHNPVTGAEVARVSAEGADLGAALKYSRQVGNPALAALHYGQRAELLGRIAEVLQAHRDEYFAISRENAGTTEGDASFDVDGALYTLKSYARAGRALGEARHLNDGAPLPLSKTGAFQGQHFLVPLSGVAVFINAFNFPAWGLWEKAAPALLAGVPVLVKPATPTAWLTQRMVADVVAAGILPPGALSIVCGSARDLLDHVEECDVVSFTGSADTAALIRRHPNVVARSVRVNIEADSVNSAVLGPDVTPESPVFPLLVREVVREMTVKSGQKCTAIRRILVPRPVADALAQAIAQKLADYPVGDPSQEGVKMGPLVSVAQADSARAGIARLLSECELITGGGAGDADSGAAPGPAFVPPTLLRCDLGLAARVAHDTEVFGPVATLFPYDHADEAVALARRGRGSLVASVFSDDGAFLARFSRGIADLHGRLLVVNAEVGNQHTGHGNVLPNCLHGGPGRAGGGEELGGLRGLFFYHRRTVIQGPTPLLDAWRAQGAATALLEA